jgi:hypothetical protein
MRRNQTQEKSGKGQNKGQSLNIWRPMTIEVESLSLISMLSEVLLESSCSSGISSSKPLQTVFESSTLLLVQRASCFVPVTML